MPLIIRPRAESDLDALVALLAESHRTDQYPLMGEHVNADWLTEKGDPVWVAELDGVVVGHAGVVGTSGSPLELTRLVVSPTARGAGVAAGLLDVIDDHAAAVGSSLYLEVLELNAAAIRLYERRGWRMTSSDVANWFGTDGPHPVIRSYVKL